MKFKTEMNQTLEDATLFYQSIGATLEELPTCPTCQNPTTSGVDVSKLPIITIGNKNYLIKRGKQIVKQ